MSENIARCPHCGTDFTPSHLLAEIERLTGLLAEWENHAGPYKDAEIERLRLEWQVSEAGHRKTMAQLTDTAAFLDEMASTLDDIGPAGTGYECRTMAKKLRGET